MCLCNIGLTGISLQIYVIINFLYVKLKVCSVMLTTQTQQMVQPVEKSQVKKQCAIPASPGM